MAYLKSRDYSDGYKRDILGYLDRCVTTISSPADVISVFSGVKCGRRHLWLAMRVLFNYAEAMGLDLDVLTVLRKALPKGANSTNPDLTIPDEKAVQSSLRLLNKAYRNVEQASCKRVCLDILSDILLRHGAETTRRWLSELITDIGSKGFTVLAVLDPSMHPPDQANAVLNLFDGEISLYQT